MILESIKRGEIVEREYLRRMRDLREDADLTQREVAKVLGTSQTMYARYERGANELPLRHLIALCRLYHVSADYLLGLTASSSIVLDGYTQEEIELLYKLIRYFDDQK